MELTRFAPVAGVSCHARAIVRIYSVDTRRSVQALTGVTFVDVCMGDAVNLAGTIPAIWNTTRYVHLAGIITVMSNTTWHCSYGYDNYASFINVILWRNSNIRVSKAKK